MKNNTQSSNQKQILLLMFIFVISTSTLVYLVGKPFGKEIILLESTLLISLLILLSSYFFSSRLVMFLTKAKRAGPEEYEYLYKILEKFSEKLSIPTPKLYIANNSSLNSLSTGRGLKQGTIILTKGLLENLNSIETESVIAHEISHIKKYDTRLTDVITVLIGIPFFLTNYFITRLKDIGSFKNTNKGNNFLFLLFGLISILFAPFVASMLNLFLSKKRELLADTEAVLLTHYPEGLISALEKINKDKSASLNYASAHSCIENPCSKKRGFISGLFNSHPSMEERIKILRSM